MENTDNYDYSATERHLQPFNNPLKEVPFIEEMQDSYGKLWEFRDHIHTWSFGVNRFKNFVYLRYRVAGKTTYLPWNMNEKVAVIEHHREEYIVIVLREVDDAGVEKNHCHSIVIDSNKFHGRFDIENMITYLEGSQMESLNAEFEKSGYVPWTESSAKSTATKLNRIFLTLDRYAFANVEKPPSLGRSASQGPRAASTPWSGRKSAGGRSGSRGPQPSEPRSETNKRDGPTTEGAESSRKRRKSHLSGAAAVGSSGSALTTVSTGPSTSS